LDPVHPTRTGLEPLPQDLRQALAGDDAEFGGLVLHDHRDRIGDDEHPEQQVAVPGTGGEVGRDVAGIDVGNGRHECRAE